MIKRKQIENLSNLKQIISEKTLAFDCEYIPPTKKDPVKVNAIGFAHLDKTSKEIISSAYAIDRNQELWSGLTHLQRVSCEKIAEKILSFLEEGYGKFIMYGSNDKECLEAILIQAKITPSSKIKVYDLSLVLGCTLTLENGSQTIKLYEAAEVLGIDTKNYTQHSPEDDAKLLLQAALLVSKMSDTEYIEYKEAVFVECYGISRDQYEIQNLLSKVKSLQKQIKSLTTQLANQKNQIKNLEKKVNSLKANTQKKQQDSKPKKKKKKKKKKKAKENTTKKDTKENKKYQKKENAD